MSIAAATIAVVFDRGYGKPRMLPLGGSSWLSLTQAPQLQAAECCRLPPERHDRRPEAQAHALVVMLHVVRPSVSTAARTSSLVCCCSRVARSVTRPAADTLMCSCTALNTCCQGGRSMRNFLGDKATYV